MNCAFGSDGCAETLAHGSPAKTSTQSTQYNMHRKSTIQQRSLACTLAYSIRTVATTPMFFCARSEHDANVSYGCPVSIDKPPSRWHKLRPTEKCLTLLMREPPSHPESVAKQAHACACTNECISTMHTRSFIHHVRRIGQA